ncbi:hypothetical protein ACCC96_17345 [Pseudomonas sp. Pseusp11]|uniref:hypothetical protein n=1 Tax=Pseudomonas sp. Pseusp11 TaxID=3243003 RepID=UPI00037D12C8
MSALRIKLEKLYSYTQTSLAKRIVAFLVLPYVLHKVVEKSHEVFQATVDLVQTMGFWQSLPYAVACSLVMVITRQAVVIGRNLRKAHMLRLGSR